MRKLLFYGMTGVVLLYCLFPFAWTLLTALKPEEEVFSLPITYLPGRISSQNIENVFYRRPFLQYVLNSFVVAGGATGLALLIASMIAFRLKSMALGKAMIVQRGLLVGAIAPPSLLAIPAFLLMRELGLVNSRLGLILAYTGLNLPFAVWMLHAAFRQLPRELDEAAMLDGYSFMGRIFGVALPLSKPALSVTALLVFIFCWNEFILALTLMPSREMYTVPVGVAMLSGTSIYEIPWGQVNAAVALTTAPIILIIALLQRWIIEGLTKGAIKG